MDEGPTVLVYCVLLQFLQQWAIHTGRFREGVDVDDWVAWKTRLRCALNKAPDIEEVKNESRGSTEEQDPYKVFLLHPRQSQ
jgi:Interferon regulatory factor transcription factor